MDVPVERIDRLLRRLRRALAVGLVVAGVSLVQTVGWFAAVAGWIELPLIDEAVLASQLTRPPDSVMFSGLTTTTHTLWAFEDEYAVYEPFDTEERRKVARGLRATGFARVYGPADPMPDGLLAECTISTTWEHPFVVRTRQSVAWGDPVDGQRVVLTSRRAWVLVGWWELEPEVVKERWFNRENL